MYFAADWLAQLGVDRNPESTRKKRASGTSDGARLSTVAVEAILPLARLQRVFTLFAARVASKGLPPVHAQLSSTSELGPSLRICTPHIELQVRTTGGNADTLRHRGCR